MKDFINKIFGYVFGIFKDDPTDTKLSIGRTSFIVLFCVDLGIWLSGSDIQEGMVSVTMALMAYVMGSKAINKITDVVQVIADAKAIREATVGTTSASPTKAKYTKQG